MLQKNTTTKYASIFVALLTFVGIALHDTKVDRMAMLAIALPVIAATDGAYLLMSADGSHTHVEKVSIKHNAMAQLHARQGKDRKYRMQKNASPNGEELNGYYLPVTA